MFRTVLVLLVLAFVSFSDISQYQEGFKEGFKQGYCYMHELGCLPPIPPLPPLPELGEGRTYVGGYKRGFLVGIAARQRRPKRGF